MGSRFSPLLTFLDDRSSVAGLDEEGWSLLLAEARAGGLMSRLAVEFLADASTRIPDRVEPHLIAAVRQAEALQHDVMCELLWIGKALNALETRVILLKGAAYVAAGLPAARGRIFSDIDLLVGRPSIAACEAALMLGGWVTGHLDAYDQRYYREWSHEIPPLTHVQRGTTVDLHHSLVMPTCRIHVDSASMIEAAIPIAGTNWYRLSDEDIVLHAASHLLLNAEFDRGLRDLWDVDILLRHFGTHVPDFPDRVLARAAQVGLVDVTRQAFMLCRHFFGTRLPTPVSGSVGGIVLALLEMASNTRHPETRPRWQMVADWLLSLRELSLRLPPQLLLRHLLHKLSQGFERRQSPAL